MRIENSRRFVGKKYFILKYRIAVRFWTLNLFRNTICITMRDTQVAYIG